MKPYLPLAILALLFTLNTYSRTDSIQPILTVKKSFLKNHILPISFIAGGILLNKTNFEKSFQKDVRKVIGNNFHSSLEDYTRYAPIGQIFVADILGVKAKNHWFDQSKNLAISIIITDFITFRLKKNIHKTRPNNSSIPESFPSGHTSFAFVNAQVLYEEFKDTCPTLAYSGYAFASTTGALRIFNNAHYISDVLVGAGIGILVTKIVYLLDPIIPWNPFKKTKNVVFIPQISPNNIGLHLSMKF